ncbi:MAG: hypothetical protein AB7G12_05795 [Thermoanaerobaculia bacterium]
MTTPRKLSPLTADLLGAALFLFIPLVLYLFVAHPAPAGWSLAAGVGLMLGHRFLARPYFLARRPVTCAWCHRTFAANDAVGHALDLTAGKEKVAILACEQHVDPTRRFFGFLDSYRPYFRASIALPLLAMLVAIGALAAGNERGIAWTPSLTDLFRLLVGITVHVAALGPYAGSPVRAARAAFPVHNFYLLGIRATLWIFRLVGVWWIVVGGHALLSRL